MDSDNFFGYDTSRPLEDDGEIDDDEYDALNDETFGSAAVGGDWEENHKQLSSLTEAERLRRSLGKDFGLQNEQDYYRLHNLHSHEDLPKTLKNLSVSHSNSFERRRLYERSVDSSPLIELPKDDVSSSPGSSIWNPNLGLCEMLENLQQLKKPLSQCNNFNTRLSSNEAQIIKANNLRTIQDFNLTLRSTIPSTVKTVSELEEELRRQPSYNNQQGGSKFRTVSATDLERELSRQMMLRKQQSSNLMGARNPNANIHNSFMQHFPNTFVGNIPAGPGQVHSNGGNFQHLNNFSGNGMIHNHAQYAHPFLNNLQGKNIPPGLLSNASNLLNKHHINQANHRGGASLNRGFFQGRNMNRNYAEKKNYEQNGRYEQSRNNHGERQREKSGGQGGNRIRRDSDAEWEEWQRIRQIDDYCGLMTPSEKAWLRNIQSMQLQTENPYQDDYYYVMHNAKQQKRREEEVIEIDSLQLLLHDKGKEGKEYEPPRLENSLGKLQVVSVNAPRKIIDLQVVHLDSSHPITILQRDMRKHRHLLLHIEKLYNIQIELDDLERKIRALPDCPTRDLFRSKCRQLVSKLWLGLTHPHESFVQSLCIKKGKTLSARLMSWLTQTEIEHLLATITQNLSLLTKKDIHDKRLPLFWPFADRFFNCSSASTVVSFGIMMGPQLKEQKKPFIPAISSKLGLSMVLSLLVRGEELSVELEKDEAWQLFLKDVVLSLSCKKENDDSSVQPLPSVTLAAAGRKPISHILKCKDVDQSTLRHAAEVLQRFESYLTSNSPSCFTSSSSITQQYTSLPHSEPQNPHITYTNADSRTHKTTIE